MTDVLSMGGYGWYVWGSYGVAVLCILIEIILLKKRSRETQT
jgi:heme exporter protein D